MVGAIHQSGFDVHQRVLGQHAFLYGVADASLHSRHVLPGDHHASELLLEDEARALLQGFQFQHHVSVLAMSAGLALQPRLRGDGAGDGLVVGHLRCADVGRHLELALHALHEHLQVEFSHARDNRLLGPAVLSHLKGRILFDQAVQSQRHFVLVGFGLRLDGH